MVPRFHNRSNRLTLWKRSHGMKKEKTKKLAKMSTIPSQLGKSVSQTDSWGRPDVEINVDR